MMNKHEKLAEGRTIIYEELLLPEETEAQRKKNMQLFRDIPPYSLGMA